MERSFRQEWEGVMGPSPISCSHWRLVALIAVASAAGVAAAGNEATSAADEDTATPSSRSCSCALNSGVRFSLILVLRQMRYKLRSLL